MQLYGSLSILWHCLSLGLECKLTFSSPVAPAEFSIFAGILNAAGKPTQRVGKYQNNDEENEKWYPIYDTDENDFRDCFHRTGKGQFAFQSQRKAMPKNAQTTALISHASKVMLKILQARLQQYVNCDFQTFKLVLEKAEEPEIK